MRTTSAALQQNRDGDLIMPERGRFVAVGVPLYAGGAKVASGAIFGFVEASKHPPSNGDPLVFLTPDESQPFTLNQATVFPVSTEGTSRSNPGYTIVRREHVFSLMHAPALTREHCLPEIYQGLIDHSRAEVEAEMLQAANADVKDLQRVVLALEGAYSLVRDKFEKLEKGFVARWDSPMSRIQSGSQVVFHSYTMMPAVERFAESLRKREVSTVYYHHEVMHPKLIQGDWGRRFLTSLTKVDKAYFYVDPYIEMVREQWDEMSRKGMLDLSSIPELKTFPFGPDQERVRASVALVDFKNIPETVPGWRGLSAEQKITIQQLATAQLTGVPCSWICWDKLGPYKGTATVYQAMEKFLTSELEQLGGDMDGLRKRHQVFFFQARQSAPGDSGWSTIGAYNEVSDRIYNSLKEKFPGVFWKCGPLEGEASDALQGLSVGSNVIVGSPVDGYNIAGPEVIMANAIASGGPKPVGFVVSRGAGCAMEMSAHPAFSEYKWFPKPGQIDEFVAAFKDISKMQLSEDGKRVLSERIGKVWSDYLEPRHPLLQGDD